ncbi:MAG: carbon storage regulator CsrA [Bacillota bacterium]|jgi:carbon storage regulator
MLVLTRKRDQVVVIGDSIVVKIIDIGGDTVKIGIDAPKDVSIHRLEVYEEIKKENQAGSRNIDSNVVAELEKMMKGS